MTLANSSVVSAARLVEHALRAWRPCRCRAAARRCASAADHRLVEPSSRASRVGELADPLAVAAGVGVLGLERRREREHHVLVAHEVLVIDLEPEQRAHPRQQLEPVDRRDQQIVGGRLEGAQPQAALLVGGDQDRPAGRPRRRSALMRRQTSWPDDARHADVEDHQVGLVRGARRRAPPRRRGARFDLVALSLEQLAVELAIGGLSSATRIRAAGGDLGHRQELARSACGRSPPPPPPPQRPIIASTAAGSEAPARASWRSASAASRPRHGRARCRRRWPPPRSSIVGVKASPDEALRVAAAVEPLVMVADDGERAGERLDRRRMRSPSSMCWR